MISPKCCLCIPFSSNELYRKKAFEVVYEYYKQLGYYIFVGESEEPFNRAAARNACVPSFLDWDILVFLDADILVPLPQIEKAIDTAFKNQEMVLAYTNLYFLDKEQTDLFHETKEIANNWKKKVENQTSGAFAIPKKLWNKVGGQDERFTKWGGEDRAFYYTCAAFTNQKENKRISGYAYHLWHEKNPTDDFSFLRINALLCQYRNALELSEKFYTYKDQFSLESLLPILKAERGPLNCDINHGFLSCPTNALTSVNFNNIPLKENPIIGVTMPCYKSKEFIKIALDSVLNQTYKNFIVFVVSDADFASFDEIKDIRDNRVCFLRSKRNIGRYAIDHYLVNHVLPMFNCTYWAPIDSDDYVDKDYLKLLINRIKTKNYNVVFTDQTRQRVNGITDRLNVVPFSGEERLFRSACVLSLWDLRFVIENNLTNSTYRVGWDSLMTLTAQVIGKYSIIKKPLYHIVKREDSLTTSKKTGMGTVYRSAVRTKLNSIWTQILSNPNNAHEILRKNRRKVHFIV
jgi:glycosyltransferase involved in cell wall biosynthesis